MKPSDLAHLSNAARARLLARIVVSLADRLGGEVRIPMADLERGGQVGFALSAIESRSESIADSWNAA